MALNEFPGFDSTAKGGKGGLWGKIAGMGAAAVAAPFTGGASLSLMPMAGEIGGMIGGAADPGKVEPGITRPKMLESVAKQDPQMTLALLDQGRKDAVGRQDIPVDQLHPILNIIDDAKKQVQGRMALA